MELTRGKYQVAQEENKQLVLKLEEVERLGSTSERVGKSSRQRGKREEPQTVTLRG